LLLDVCARWAKGAPPARRELLRHALRWLVKKGDARALSVLGFESAHRLRVEGALQPQRVRIGEACRIAISVHNRSRRAQSLGSELRRERDRVRDIGIRPVDSSEVAGTAAMRVAGGAPTPGRLTSW